MINKKTSNPCRVKFSELYMATQILETFKSLFYYINLIHSFIFFIKNNKVLLSGVSSDFIVNKMWWLICGILFSWNWQYSVIVYNHLDLFSGKKLKIQFLPKYCLYKKEIDVVSEPTLQELSRWNFSKDMFLEIFEFSKVFFINSSGSSQWKLTILR